jgi:hypothetical protein
MTADRATPCGFKNSKRAGGSETRTAATVLAAPAAAAYASVSAATVPMAGDARRPTPTRRRRASVRRQTARSYATEAA